MSGVILPGMLKGDPRNAKPDLQTWQFGFLFFFFFFFWESGNLAFDQLKPPELTIGPTKIQKNITIKEWDR